MAPPISVAAISNQSKPFLVVQPKMIWPFEPFHVQSLNSTASATMSTGIKPKIDPMIEPAMTCFGRLLLVNQPNHFSKNAFIPVRVPSHLQKYLR